MLVDCVLRLSGRKLRLYARDGVHAIFLEYDKEADYYALPRPLVKLIDGLLSVDPARRLDIAGADALAALI